MDDNEAKRIYDTFSDRFTKDKLKAWLSYLNVVIGKNLSKGDTYDYAKQIHDTPTMQQLIIIFSALRKKFPILYLNEPEVRGKSDQELATQTWDKFVKLGVRNAERVVEEVSGYAPPAEASPVLDSSSTEEKLVSVEKDVQILIDQVQSEPPNTHEEIVDRCQRTREVSVPKMKSVIEKTDLAPLDGKADKKAVCDAIVTALESERMNANKPIEQRIALKERLVSLIHQGKEQEYDNVCKNQYNLIGIQTVFDKVGGEERLGKRDKTEACNQVKSKIKSFLENPSIARAAPSRSRSASPPRAPVASKPASKPKVVVIDEARSRSVSPSFGSMKPKPSAPPMVILDDEEPYPIPSAPFAETPKVFAEPVIPGAEPESSGKPCIHPIYKKWNCHMEDEFCKVVRAPIEDPVNQCEPKIIEMNIAGHMVKGSPSVVRSIKEQVEKLSVQNQSKINVSPQIISTSSIPKPSVSDEEREAKRQEIKKRMDDERATQLENERFALEQLAAERLARQEAERVRNEKELEIERIRLEAERVRKEKEQFEMEKLAAERLVRQEEERKQNLLLKIKKDKEEQERLNREKLKQQTLLNLAKFNEEAEKRRTKKVMIVEEEELPKPKVVIEDVEEELPKPKVLIEDEEKLLPKLPSEVLDVQAPSELLDEEPEQSEQVNVVIPREAPKEIIGSDMDLIDKQYNQLQLDREAERERRKAERRAQRKQKDNKEEDQSGLSKHISSDLIDEMLNEAIQDQVRLLQNEKNLDKLSNQLTEDTIVDASQAVHAAIVQKNKEIELARAEEERAVKAAAEARALEEAKADEEARVAAEERAAEQARIQAQAKADAEERAAEQARLLAEKKAKEAEEERIASEIKAKAKAAAEAKIKALAEEKAAEEARVLAEKKAAEEARLLAAQKAIEEARLLAAQKIKEEELKLKEAQRKEEELIKIKKALEEKVKEEKVPAVKSVEEPRRIWYQPDENPVQLTKEVSVRVQEQPLLDPANISVFRTEKNIDKEVMDCLNKVSNSYQ